MKLKQLFCRHKKLTAAGIYERLSASYTFSSTGRNIYIACECDKCGKEIEYNCGVLQYLKNQRIKEINIDKVFNHELWGKWW
jgi:hypothetical protein